MWRELREYGAALLRHWWAAVPGIFGTLVGLGTALFPALNVSPFVWGTAAILGLFLAQYLAYRDLRRRSNEKASDLRNRLDEATALASARTSHRQVREGLGRLLSSGEDLRKRINAHSWPSSSSLGNLAYADAKVWNDEFWAWIREAEEFLASNLGPHYVDRFKSSTGIEGPDTDRYIVTGRDHIPYLNSMHYRLTRLNQFLSELRD